MFAGRVRITCANKTYHGILNWTTQSNLFFEAQAFRYCSKYAHETREFTGASPEWALIPKATALQEITLQ